MNIVARRSHRDAITALLLTGLVVGCSSSNDGAPAGGSAGGPASTDSGASDAPSLRVAMDGSSVDGSPAVDGASAEGSGDASAVDAPGGGDAAPALALGTVTVTRATEACPGNPGAGAKCMGVTVSCPGIPDIDATIATIEPTGTPKGTIVAHAGGSGTGFFSAGPEGKGFNTAYTAAGFRYVQIAWATDWASGEGSIKTAACRPATAFHWMFESIHGASKTTGFCGTGTSGGSAALTYSLTAYGLKSVWDYVLLGAGPAPARIDYGCDPTLYTGAPRNLCPELTAAPYDYTTGVTTIADGWEHTSTCGAKNPPAANQTQWASDSVAFPGADFDYPQTGLSWWFCTTTPNETTGQGSFLIDQVHPKNPTVDVHCYGGAAKPSVCENEYVFEDPGAFSSAVAEMTADCTPNH